MSKFSVSNLLGNHIQSYVGYAVDSKVRYNAASGGAVGAITRYLLENDIVQGVLASEVIVENGEVIPKSKIARTQKELNRCRNSIYLDFNLGSKNIYNNLIEELKVTNNRIAVVGLYCHLSQLQQLMERRGVGRNRVIMIGLFCSHAPHRVLLNKVLDRQTNRMHDANDYITKTGEGGKDGRLHGMSTILFENGDKKEFKFLEFTTFKNAWFYTPKKCLVCPDQFSEVADISCGDAWYKEIRKHRYKWTTIVARTSESNRIICSMARDRKMELRLVDPQSIVSSQRRVAGVEKAALAARVKLAPMFGMKLPAAEGDVRMRDLAHSVLMLSAVKISNYDNVMRFIMKLPTPMVLVFTLLIKVIEESLLAGFGKGSGVGKVITGHNSED